jgi:hypothetical protein
MPRSYWQASDRGTLDSEDPISVNSRLIDLEQDAIRYGFAGLFDAVLAMAKSEAPSFKQSTDTFVQGGGLSELIGDCLRSPEYIGNLPAHLGKVMTDTVGTLYLQEWRKLVSHSGFRRPLTSLSADYAKEFSFTDIYRAMTSCAPSLIQLFSLLTEKTMVTPSATTAEVGSNFFVRPRKATKSTIQCVPEFLYRVPFRKQYSEARYRSFKPIRDIG